MEKYRDSREKYRSSGCLSIRYTDGNQVYRGVSAKSGQKQAGSKTGCQAINRMVERIVQTYEHIRLSGNEALKDCRLNSCTVCSRGASVADQECGTGATERRWRRPAAAAAPPAPRDGFRLPNRAEGARRAPSLLAQTLPPSLQPPARCPAIPRPLPTMGANPAPSQIPLTTTDESLRKHGRADWGQ